MSDYLPAGVTDEQCSSNPPDKEEDYEYEGGERYCWACGGRGWKITCPDDLCHGQDECIHGDPPTPCWECNRNGEMQDDG